MFWLGKDWKVVDVEQWFPTGGKFPPGGKFGCFRGEILVIDYFDSLLICKNSNETKMRIKIFFFHTSYRCLFFIYSICVIYKKIFQLFVKPMVYNLLIISEYEGFLSAIQKNMFHRVGYTKMLS